MKLTFIEFPSVLHVIIIIIIISLAYHDVFWSWIFLYLRTSDFLQWNELILENSIENLWIYIYVCIHNVPEYMYKYYTEWMKTCPD